MTSLDLSPELYLGDKLAALEILAEALENGYLTLFIGSGTSKSATAQFPSWIQLVKGCAAAKNIAFEETSAASNEYLRNIAGEVEKRCDNTEFIEIIQGALYSGIQYDITLMKTDLLVALGSLVMGSVRGTAHGVVNYNFDDVLEWYLDYHGFRTQVVSSYPALTSKADVVVYHPHGFLPYLEKYRAAKTNKVIFSRTSYLDANSREVDPWNELQRSMLGSNLALFIGMSGEDPHVETLCHYVYSRTVEKKRILGFIVLLDNDKNRAKESANIDVGLVNIYLKDHNELPGFLLDICRRSAQL